MGKTNLGRMAKSKVVLYYKFEHTNRELDELLTCRRGAPGLLNRGRRPAWADWPGWPRALSSSGFFQHTHLLCDFCACVLHRLHRPNSLIHSFACIIGPSTWCLCFESCPCSFASHASMIFFAKQGLLPTHSCPLHVALMKVVGRASRDASWCMHDLFN
jgi:hypothetical protein